MATQKRVAVIGAGISGAFCGVRLRAQGIQPIVFDAGRRGPGGRLSSPGGASFFFAEGSRFQQVIESFEAMGLAAKWEGPFGLLGAKGGFLPLETIHKATGNRPDLDGGNQNDFCGFVQSAGQLTVGMPSNMSLASRVLEMAKAEIRQGSSVINVSLCDPSVMSWRITSVDGNSQERKDVFDAVVFATHNPALADGALSAAIGCTEDTCRPRP